MQVIVLADTPNMIRVALSGELNTLTVGQIETKFTVLMSGDGQDVIVDMSEVSFITSLGIGMLISASKVVKRRNAKFVVLKPQPLVLNILEASKLMELLGVATEE